MRTAWRTYRRPHPVSYTHLDVYKRQSYDWSEIETEALEIDVDGFLAKPFTTINLKEKLIEVENFKNAVSGPEVALELKGLHPAGGRASGRTAASGKEEWSAWRSRSSRV